MLGSDTNRTHIFSKQHNGLWQETLRLEKSYENYQISGRSLIATSNEEVYAMDISDCTYDIPTMTPSISPGPTSCYDIDIKFNFTDWRGECLEDSWDVTIKESTFLESDSSIIKTYTYQDGLSCGSSISTCLAPGRYEFKLRLFTSLGNDAYRIELSFPGEESKRHELVFEETLSGFSIIAFTHTENAIFDIPFDPETLRRPTVSPTTSPTEIRYTVNDDDLRRK